MQALILRGFRDDKHAQAGNHLPQDPSELLESPLLEKPEEPGPEDCCQVTNLTDMQTEFATGTTASTVMLLHAWPACSLFLNAAPALFY